MNHKDYQNSSSGKIFPSINGYHYFLPNPLPPVIQFNEMEFVHLATEAASAVGQLSGLGYTIPNPDFLVIPYTRLEAVASSRIEGTQASLSELFYFEAAPERPKSSEDIVEVRNYLYALNSGIKRLDSLPLSLRLVRELHKDLMEGVRGGTNDLTPGEFRRSQNWIGRPGCNLNDATYVPPHQSELLNLMGNWENFLHSNSKLPLLIQCAVMHYQFEAIHPFLDGNGRVGRLLVTLFLMEKKVLSQPLLYLSAYFEQHRTEYYHHLLMVSQKGQWQNWLKFFLTAVIIQSQHAITSAKQILDERDHYRRILQEKKASSASMGMIDFIFLHPYFTVQQAAQSLKYSYNTANRSIAELQRLNFVEEVTKQSRNRVYVARQLLEMLVKNEPIYKPSDTADES